jgi:predicted N-formylglutamate amidohydrolase
MADRGTQASGLAGEEGASHCVLPGRIYRGLIVLCDHASNALPPGYGTLGLPPEQLRRHIAYDIGAEAVVRALAGALEVPAVMTRYSRLLIDPNRGRDDPTLIMRLSDGAAVPGNRTLDDAERERRLSLYYEPYHRAIDATIDRFLAEGVTPVLLSIHSFTESWKQFPRPWHVAVLWGDDARLARPLLEAFYAEGDLIVGENEPYSGHLEGDCLWQHGGERGLASAIVEIRQDLIRDVAGQEAWGRRMARIVEKVLELPASPGSRHREVGNGEWGMGERPSFANLPLPTPDLPIPQPARPKHGDGPMTKIDKTLTTELEAAAFRRLAEHLRQRADVQNIDLMNLAGFCRNCLSNWYQEAAAERGVDLTKDAAREIVYGMPYKEWQAKHQKEASAESVAAFEKSKPHSH